MEKTSELTILMPCLNEEETLETCIRKAQQFLTSNGISGEVLIADNGSTDRSKAIADLCGARVIDVLEKGYGSALKGGIKASKSKFVIMGDADDSYDFSDLMQFVIALRNGTDLVIGNRFLGGISKGAMPPLHKYLGNPLLSFLGKLFYRININDFHCGLRGFNLESIQKLDLKSSGMEFASEIIVSSALSELKIIEVPTTLKKDGRSRPPHLRTWRDGWRHLRFLLLYSPRWLFLYPGIILSCTSGLLFGTIELSNFHLLGVHFGVSSLVLAFGGVEVGTFMILFSILTKVHGENRNYYKIDETFRKYLQFFSLEKCLVGSLVFLLCGISLFINAVLTWKSHNFQDLNAVSELHKVIPAVGLIVGGSQIAFFSFFLSILEL